jgi:hypothetical protein
MHTGEEERSRSLLARVLGGDAAAAMAAVGGVLRAGVSTGSTRSPADFVPHQALTWAMEAAAAATSAADWRRMVRMLPALNHQMWYAWHAAAWSGPGQALQAHGAATLWTASRLTHVHALLTPPVPVRHFPSQSFPGHPNQAYGWDTLVFSTSCIAKWVER